MRRDTKTTRVAAWIWYRGDRFRGYQAQPGGQTVQQVLQDAFLRAGVPVSLSAPAGRTDLGVHARMQVLSLRIGADVSPEAWVRRVSPHLPAEAIGFVGARVPHPGFQAHWSAAGKTYHYRLALGGEAPFAWSPALHPRFAGATPDPARLADALSRMTGSRDFIAFHEKSSVRKVRTLSSATLHPLGRGLYEARLVGDAFARYQVRYLVGAAALAAAGKLETADLVAALEGGTPVRGVKAPAEALVLWEVHYAEVLDPFSRAERDRAPGVPGTPPFTAGADPRTSPGDR